MTQEIYTHGKLLLTGEYLVLSGATALAVPCRLGQRFQFKEDAGVGIFTWRSYDHRGAVWFEGQFDRSGGTFHSGSDEPTGKRLEQLFAGCYASQPDWDGLAHIHTIESHLEFPRDWGLGSSSTLVAALAQFAGADAYQLLQDSFGGSGYDLACAVAEKPLLYQIHHDRGHSVEIPYQPNFTNQIYFVHLGQKQNSRRGIRRYRDRGAPSEATIHEASQLTLAWLQAPTLAGLENIIRRHEALISTQIGLEPVQPSTFPDYWGAIKSLGAWGGDFVLATSDRSEEETRAYFRERGFQTVLGYGEMVR